MTPAIIRYLYSKAQQLINSVFQRRQKNLISLATKTESNLNASFYERYSRQSNKETKKKQKAIKFVTDDKKERYMKMGKHKIITKMMRNNLCKPISNRSRIPSVASAANFSKSDEEIFLQDHRMFDQFGQSISSIRSVQSVEINQNQKNQIKELLSIDSTKKVRTVTSTYQQDFFKKTKSKVPIIHYSSPDVQNYNFPTRSKFPAFPETEINQMKESNPFARIVCKPGTQQMKKKLNPAVAPQKKIYSALSFEKTLKLIRQKQEMEKINKKLDIIWSEPDNEERSNQIKVDQSYKQEININSNIARRNFYNGEPAYQEQFNSRKIENSYGLFNNYPESYSGAQARKFV